MNCKMSRNTSGKKTVLDFKTAFKADRAAVDYETVRKKVRRKVAEKISELSR